jgi:chromosome segregation ATPase
MSTVEDLFVAEPGEEIVLSDSGEAEEVVKLELTEEQRNRLEQIQDQIKSRLESFEKQKVYHENQVKNQQKSVDLAKAAFDRNLDSLKQGLKQVTGKIEQWNEEISDARKEHEIKTSENVQLKEVVEAFASQRKNLKDLNQKRDVEFLEFDDSIEQYKRTIEAYKLDVEKLRHNLILSEASRMDHVEVMAALEKNAPSLSLHPPKPKEKLLQVKHRYPKKPKIKFDHEKLPSLTRS